MVLFVLMILCVSQIFFAMFVVRKLKYMKQFLHCHYERGNKQKSKYSNCYKVIYFDCGEEDFSGFCNRVEEGDGDFIKFSCFNEKNDTEIVLAVINKSQIREIANVNAYLQIEDLQD